MENNLNVETFKKYDDCDHFVIKCADDYDWYEGTHNYSHGCIKCGLCNGGVFYDETMKSYFYNGGLLFRGYGSKLMFGLSYETSYGVARELYKKISEENPNITNSDLAIILKSESERIKSETNPGVERKRRIRNGK